MPINKLRKLVTGGIFHRQKNCCMPVKDASVSSPEYATDDSKLHAVWIYTTCRSGTGRQVLPLASQFEFKQDGTDIWWLNNLRFLVSVH